MKIHGPRGIAEHGHREYVGGKWDVIGPLQLAYLRLHGLEPHHVLLDIGCGALRGGVHFIRYLESGNYLGIDRWPQLLEAGKEELGEDVFHEKRPELIVSDWFEFERFTKRPDYAWAHSLFTHLPPHLIRFCLEKLYGVAHPRMVLFATFFEGDGKANPPVAHDHARFEYRPADFAAFAPEWEVDLQLPDWGHPRGQLMLRFTPR